MPIPSWVGDAFGFEEDQPQLHAALAGMLPSGNGTMSEFQFRHFLRRVQDRWRRGGFPDDTFNSMCRGVASVILQKSPLQGFDPDQTFDFTRLLFETSTEEVDHALDRELEIDGEKRYQFSAEEIYQRPPPGFLIDKLLPEKEVSILYGEESVGKTFLAVDWALSVATGKRWKISLSRDIQQGRVVYVCLEEPRDVGDRIKAWLDRNELDFSALKETFVLHEDCPLTGQDHYQEGVENIITETIKSYDTVPQLVIIDNLFAISGAEVLDQVGMSYFMAAMKTLSRKLKCTVLVIHHANEKGDPFGSRLLRANVSAALLVEKRGKNGHRLICRKMRREERFEPVDFDRERVYLPETDRYSCVLIPHSQLSDSIKEVYECIRDKKCYTPKEIAKALGIQPRNVQRVLRVLLEKKLIVKRKKGRESVYEARTF
jgi:hypothetical protein